jgi:hypothetical protein
MLEGRDEKSDIGPVARPRKSGIGEVKNFSSVSLCDFGINESAHTQLTEMFVDVW